MRTKLVLIFLICFSMTAEAQDQKLPYYEIPDYPEEYNSCTTVARMIDGLGFRYYWATEGLRDEDYNYKPSENGRTTGETMDHILGLTTFVLNSALKKKHTSVDPGDMTYAEKRELTLNNIKTAADIFRGCEDISSFKIEIARGDDVAEFPFWNNINGPIADALWHCGQVVVLRRASGNPFNSKASLFTGKIRN